MKHIVLITEELSNSTHYVSTLLRLFGQQIRVQCFSVRENNFRTMPQDADLYLISCTSSGAYKEVTAHIPGTQPVVPVKVTFLKRDIEALQMLPAGTRALLVNFSMQMAIESIAELHRLGITQIELFPYCPGTAIPPHMEMAITPGEPQCVPPEFNSVLNLGSRVFSSETILEIGLKLGFTWLPASEAFQKYAGELADPGMSFAALWSSGLQTEAYLDILMGALKTGIIGVDMKDKVFASNSVAAELLGIEGRIETGTEITALLPGLGGIGGFHKQVRLEKLNGTFLNLSVAPVDWQGTRIGSFLLLQKFTEEENRQHKLRAQLRNWGYRAKYTMEDIIGESEAIRQTKALAVKMARTDSAILLTGESGTGKELFGHSIHNASRRREMPFVAINCAALTETLLESELFGYEEGAFTGAKKGGKAGLFEYAHMGTLFLDEVEAMSPLLQAKLLRVLQEKELIRVGGDRVIPVDVRVVASSNENIHELVAQGAFRRDLFYRLNTLPLQIPPLRERGDDLFLIAASIKKRMGYTYTLSPEARQLLRDYCWEGNVRELSNLIEYLAVVGKAEITPADLPAYLQTQRPDRPLPQPEGPSLPETDLQDFWAQAAGQEERYCFVLRALAAAEGGVGRGQLCRLAQEEQLQLTEQMARDILNALNRLGLVSVSRGRGGSTLTRAGAALAEQL